jgi:hypothetical protein
VEDVIAGIAAKANLRPEQARQAAGVVLGLLLTQGNKTKVAELFDHVPGAVELAAAGSSGGLMNKMAGGMMGGPLAAVSKMQSLGVSGEQNKIVTTLLIEHLRKHGGDTLLRGAAANIPGISGYL